VRLQTPRNDMMVISWIAKQLSHCPNTMGMEYAYMRLCGRLTGTKMLSAPLVNFIHAPGSGSGLDRPRDRIGSVR